MTKGYFLTAIGTDVGKTVASAVLCEALEADYWKPVQAGSLDNTDSDVVRGLLTNKKSIVHPEVYKLKTPCSPHLAAKIDDVGIKLGKIVLPKTDSTLIVEGAGGLLVPLNETETVIDLIQHLGLPVILVSKNYLGSINHTLLSLEALKNKGIKVDLLIFSGESNKETEEIIKSMSGVKKFLGLPELKEVTKAEVEKTANEIRAGLNEFIR